MTSVNLYIENRMGSCITDACNFSSPFPPSMSKSFGLSVSQVKINSSIRIWGASKNELAPFFGNIEPQSFLSSYLNHTSNFVSSGLFDLIMVFTVARECDNSFYLISLKHVCPAGMNFIQII